MIFGIEPPMKPVGNPQLRLQTLQQTVANWQKTNPQMFQMLQTNPIVQALFANRVKMLGFDVQQLANADIGRNGVAPVMGGGQAGGPMQLGMTSGGPQQ